jgi:hypothetical protein
MKVRRYLNVGRLHEAKPGEFLDEVMGDYFTEHEVGERVAAPPARIIKFPEPEKKSQE